MNIDMEFQVGDKVVTKPSAHVRGSVAAISGDMIDVLNAQGVITVHKRDLVFACHNHGAPFETLVCDEEAQEADGFFSGLSLGLKGRFYQAGGPGLMMDPRHTDCRHLHQHCDFEKRNNKAWRTGWAKGQEKAKMTKPLDFKKPLWTTLLHHPVYYVGMTPTGNHLIMVGSKSDTKAWSKPREINSFGTPLDLDGLIVENVREPVKHTNFLHFNKEGGLMCCSDRRMTGYQTVVELNFTDGVLKRTTTYHNHKGN